MDKKIEDKLKKWVEDTYNPIACGYTEFRSSGNESDIFNDGYFCGESEAAYTIGKILGMKLEEPAEQNYEDFL